MSELGEQKLAPSPQKKLKGAIQSRENYKIAGKLVIFAPPRNFALRFTTAIKLDSIYFQLLAGCQFMGENFAFQVCDG